MTPTVLNRQASWLCTSNNHKGGIPRPPGPGRLSAAGCSGARSLALTGLGKSPHSQPATAAHAGAGLKPPADTDVTDHTGVSPRLCFPVPPASHKGQGVRAALRATPVYWTDLTGGPIPLYLHQDHQDHNEGRVAPVNEFPGAGSVPGLQTHVSERSPDPNLTNPRSRRTINIGE